MRKRVRLKQKKKWKLEERKIKKSSKFIIIFVLLCLVIFLSFYFINKKVSPVLINYAETEMKRLSNLVITRAISKQMTEKLDVDNLFIIDKNTAGEINTIDFNPITVNKVLSTCTSTVQLNLKYVEEGRLDLIDIPSTLLTEYAEETKKKGIIYEIPSGVVFQNVLLSNIGPKIPVRLHLVGDIESNIHTKVTDYGINNALVEVFVKIKVAEQVILPFISKTIVVETDIPVAIKLITGKIPDSYYGNLGKSSSTLSIPIK